MAELSFPHCGVCGHKWERHEEIGGNTLICYECPTVSVVGALPRICATDEPELWANG